MPMSSELRTEAGRGNENRANPGATGCFFVIRSSDSQSGIGGGFSNTRVNDPCYPIATPRQSPLSTSDPEHKFRSVSAEPSGRTIHTVLFVS